MDNPTKQEILHLNTEITTALNLVIMARKKLWALDEEITFTGNLWAQFSKIHKELHDHQRSLEEIWREDSNRNRPASGGG